MIRDLIIGFSFGAALSLNLFVAPHVSSLDKKVAAILEAHPEIIVK